MDCEYKFVTPPKEVILENGAKVVPRFTLKNCSGGIAHWIIDDNCYVLIFHVGNERYRPVKHIFREAHQALKHLPELKRDSEHQCDIMKKLINKEIEVDEGEEADNDGQKNS